jgi:hypothetical protein
MSEGGVKSLIEERLVEDQLKRRKELEWVEIVESNWSTTYMMLIIIILIMIRVGDLFYLRVLYVIYHVAHVRVRY